MPHNKNMGSGVLIIDLKRDQIILVKDYTGDYSDFGGKAMPGKTVAGTAAQEFYEESCGSHTISETYLTTCQYVQIRDAYRCYIVFASLSCTNYYKHRRALKDKQLAGSHVSSCMLETSRMTRFSITDLKHEYGTCGSIGTNHQTDRGEWVTFGGRLKGVLNRAFGKKYL
mgnify:CR=1 FL=1